METPGDLWAITCLFNPANFQSRLSNYRLFRRFLKIPLVAVEMSFGQPFQLGPADADILIQIQGQSVLWQKERLLNLALAAVPGSCRKVVWMDCDFIFARQDWAEETSQALDRFPLVQPFDRVYDLDREAAQEQIQFDKVIRVRFSIAHELAQGIAPEQTLPLRYENEGLWNGIPLRQASSTGFACGFRREVFEEHGIYDANIVGGGDRSIMAAALGQFDIETVNRQLNPIQVEHFQRWARPFQKTVGNRIGLVTGTLYHLWHGDLEDRQYGDRHRGLLRLNFDPFQDIAIADNSAWRWNTDKPGLHQFCRDFFCSRKEDG